MSLILSLVSGLGRKIDMSPFLVTLFAFELTGEKILDAEHSPCARASSGAPFAFRNWDLFYPVPDNFLVLVQADAQFTKLKSQNIRRDLVGSHMPQPVSRTLAADHLKEMADATWRFRQDTDLTCPSIWDQANPEGMYLCVECQLQR